MTEDYSVLSQVAAPVSCIVLDKVQLTVGPLGLQTHPLVIFLTPEYVIKMDIHGS